MTEPNCPRCKRPYPEGWTASVRKHKSAALKAARKVADRWGRKRNIDYMEIYVLRLTGMSLQKIADELKISRGSVQHALRIRAAVEGSGK